MTNRYSKVLLSDFDGLIATAGKRINCLGLYKAYATWLYRSETRLNLSYAEEHDVKTLFIAFLATFSDSELNEFIAIWDRKVKA